MKVPVAIHFVTHTQERCEYNTKGFAQTDADGVCVWFNADDYRMQIRFSGDTAVIVREGDCGYTMTLQKDCTHPLRIGALQTEVHTRQWLFKQSAQKIDFAAEYTLGNAQNPVKVILKASYAQPAKQNSEEI